MSDMPRAPGVAGLFTAQLVEEKQKQAAAGPRRVHPDAQSVGGDSLLARFPEKPKAPQQPQSSDAERQANLIQEIDPSLVEPWAFADRPEDEMGDLDQLTQAIRAAGQAVPGLVRPHPSKPGHYELIFGLRRWLVSKDLERPFLCVVKELDDKSAFAAMEHENNNRENLSSWAKAKSYQRALDQGVYKNQTSLAAELGLQRQTLNNLLTFFRIPRELMDAIGPMGKVSVLTAKAIVALVNDENHGERYKRTLIELAPRIRSGAMSDKVLQRVVRSNQGAAGAASAIEVVGKSGEKLGSIRRTERGSVQITLSSKLNSDLTLDDLSKRIAALLEQQGDAGASED